MKKLLMLLFLMTFSLGQSQTFPLDFSDPADAFTGFDGVSASIVLDGGDSVLQIVGATGTWDNSQLTLSQNINLADNANNTITFRFKASAGSSGQHLLKFEGGVGGAGVAEGFFNSTGTDWQIITIDFGAGLGNYSKVVIFTDSGAASNGWNNAGTGTYLIDDIAGGTNVVPVVIPAPAVAAPTPTRAVEDVISIFSGAPYTDRVGTAFAPNWGQNPTYAQVNIAGNPTNRYLNFSFVGNTFSAGGVDASAMEYLHIDIWTPDCTAFDVYILDGSAPEQKVTVNPTLSGWNSFDIALSSYTSLTKSGIVEFKFERSDAGLKTIYLDNIYFWKAPAGTFTYYADADLDTYGAGAPYLSPSPTPPAGYSVNNTDCNDSNVAVYPGATEVLNSIDDDCDGLTDEGLLPTAPTTAAPSPPARNAWDVVSVFTDAPNYNVQGTDFFPYWGQPGGYIAPTVVSIASNNTLLYQNLTYQGVQFNTPINVLTMTKLHIDVWTPDSSTLDVVLIGGGENGFVVNPTIGSWTSFDIDMSNYSGRTLNNIIQMMFRGTTPAGGKVYVDNIYYWRPATTQPPPTIGALTIPTKVVTDSAFQITQPNSNSTGTFTYAVTGNAGVATVSPSGLITIIGVGNTTITATQAADANYGSGSTIGTFVVSPNNAPTPTKPAADVISVFSDTYTDVPGTNYYPNWSQATQYTLLNVAGNEMINYYNLNYQGMQFGSPIDASAMQTLHVDIYTPDCTSFQVFIISPGPVEQAVTVTPTLAGWNSIEIPMSSYTTPNKADLIQFKFVGNGSVYLDNIYFSKSSYSVDLKLFIEGYYDSAGTMRPVKNNQDYTSPMTDVDDVTVELRDATTYAIVATTTTVLKTDGTVAAKFNPVFPAGNYFIAVKHRNAVQTWSATPQTVGSTPLTYDFTTAASQAYEDNMREIEPGVFAFYSGDITQDEGIDNLDTDLLFPDIDSSNYGVLATDLNGDGGIDNLDADVIFPNIDNSVYSHHP